MSSSSPERERFWHRHRSSSARVGNLRKRESDSAQVRQSSHAEQSEAKRQSQTRSRRCTGKKKKKLWLRPGRVFRQGSAPESGIPYGQVLAATNQAAVEGESFMQPGKERENYAFQSWGAQFVEVKVDPEIAKVTVSGVVSTFDVGTIINRKTAQSQAYSGIIMGVGMALIEHTVYDNPDGGTITSNLPDYAVPVNADIHSLEVHFIDKPDPYIDAQIGARGRRDHCDRRCPGDRQRDLPCYG
jgi:CO/xanthine dehydrogenase Mo-binding subunit